jgi:hypothetical protein
MNSLLILALGLLAAAIPAQSNAEGQIQLLARQLILSQTHAEQVVRANGGSGFEQVRQFKGGSKAFHEASYDNGGVANVHR